MWVSGIEAFRRGEGRGDAIRGTNQMSGEKNAAAPEKEGDGKRKTRRNGRETRVKIMQAACELTRDEGTDAFTIDRVISRAGVSKGAFMYHFPTRQSLIDALMSSYVDHLHEVQSGYEKTEQNRRSRKAVSPVLEAYARWYEDFQSGKCDSGHSMLLALVLASGRDPALLAPLKDWYRRYFEHVKGEPCGDAMSLLLTLVYDGLFFHHLFGTDVFTKEERKQVLELARRLAQTPEGGKTDGEE